MAIVGIVFETPNLAIDFLATLAIYITVSAKQESKASNENVCNELYWYQSIRFININWILLSV